MYDLIDECGEDLKKYGYAIKKTNHYCTSIATLSICSDKKSEEIGLNKGEYIIVNSPFLYDFGLECENYIIQILQKKLEKMMKQLKLLSSDRILLVCLGNPDISADRLGKCVFDNVRINPLSNKNNIFKFCPNIYFSTGIESVKLVKSIIKEWNIDFVLIIDSLTTNSLERLGTSFKFLKRKQKWEYDFNFKRY